MTLVQSRDDKMVLAVHAVEIDEARLLSASLSHATISAVAVEAGPSHGQMVAVPAALATVMQSVIDGIARGAQVTIQSVPREVTTTTAAKMLGISRPTLMKLIADARIPAHKVRTHTRLLAADVTAFRENQREAQRRAFEQLRALDEELGIDP